MKIEWILSIEDKTMPIHDQVCHSDQFLLNLIDSDEMFTSPSNIIIICDSELIDFEVI
jgi:hypothetical protein